MAEVYVATQTLGVYYSDDFTPAGAMPTWTAVNDGLPSTAIFQAMMDPFDNTMYVVLTASYDVYKLVDGTWELFISTEQLRDMLGEVTGKVKWITFDAALPGMIYIAFMGGLGECPAYVFKSNDYGDSWNHILIRDASTLYGLSDIQVKNNYGYLMTNIGTGAQQEARLSQNGFSSFVTSAQLGVSTRPIWYDWHDPSFGYYSTRDEDLYKIEYGNPTVQTLLQEDIGVGFGGYSCPNQMWQSRLTVGHKRGLGQGKLWVTYDSWVTLENATPDVITDSDSQLAYYPADEDVVIFGLNIVGGGVHVIKSLDDETDTTPTNRAGDQVTSPYTDSIPDNCGGLALDGIHFVREVVNASINVHGVNLNEGETDYEPMPGDRSVWNVIDYGSLHARDWDAGDSHHRAVSLADDSHPSLELDEDLQELTLDNVVTQDEFLDHYHGGDPATWPEHSITHNDFSGDLFGNMEVDGSNKPLLERNNVGGMSYFWLRDGLTYKTIDKDEAIDSLQYGAINFNYVSVIRDSVPYDDYINAYGVSHFKADGTGGNYTFTFDLYGGIKVWIDGILEIDSWSPADETEVRQVAGTVTLDPNEEVLVQVEYYCGDMDGEPNEGAYLVSSVSGSGYDGYLGALNLKPDAVYESFGYGITSDGTAVTEVDPYYLPIDFQGVICEAEMVIDIPALPAYTTRQIDYYHNGVWHYDVTNGQKIMVFDRGPLYWSYQFWSEYGDFTPSVNSVGLHIAASTGGTVDAADVTYTPLVNTDWDSDTDPGNVDDALDQLAERVDDLEGAAPGAVTRHVVFTIEGDLEVEAGVIRIPNRTGAALTISEVRLDVDTAPTGAAIIVDVNENGTTIFSTQGNRPQIAATANTGNTTTFDDASWANGNYLTIDVDQVGSTVAGSNLTVTIVCS
jgi:hypothetical protein